MALQESSRTTNPSSAADLARKNELLQRGFITVPNVLSKDLLDRLRAVTDPILDAQAEKWRVHTPTQGSMIGIQVDPIFAELFTYPPALDVLARMGWREPSCTGGYVISKPGKSPRLFWHYDWFSWEDPFSYTTEHAPVVGFMYYLTDTRRENGCLRAIPGSHNHHNPLHDLLSEPHTEALSQGTSMTSPEFSDRPDEVDVPVHAGDLVIVDARVLHSAHANQTDERRTVITLWMQTDPASLPERIAAQFAAGCPKPPDNWPESARKQLESLQLRTRYRGAATPYPRTLYRRPATPQAVG